MISRQTLKELIKQKINDADILLLNNCYENGIYIAGYALEITLKLKICNLLQFEQGFPENKYEFNVYQISVKNEALLSSAVTQLKDIKHHDLSKLLFFSGVEFYVKLHFLAEWNLAAIWNPEMRYKILKTSEDDALNKINAIKVIIQTIL